MRNLNYELKQICDRNHDGSFATRTDRSQIPNLAANQLRELGYRQMHADSLKPKHVEALVEKWRADGISNVTMKDRISSMRWWAEKIGKQNIIERDNKAYGIEDRKHVTNESKAKVVNPETLEGIRDRYKETSLRLQQAFSLRREESIKINPKWADQADYLRLKDSWTKAGMYREIPITTQQQREALEHAMAVAKGCSLIPPEMRYRDQLQRFRSECDRLDIPLRTDAVSAVEGMVGAGTKRTPQHGTQRKAKSHRQAGTVNAVW